MSTTTISYIFECATINDDDSQTLDLTMFVSRFQFVSALKNRMPQVLLTFTTSIQNMLSNDIFSQNRFKLKIFISFNDVIHKDYIELDLLSIQSSSTLPPLPNVSNDDAVLASIQDFTFQCVCTESISTLTKNINCVINSENQNNSIGTSIEIVQQIFDELNIKYDISKINCTTEELPNSYIVPPMSVRQFIDYMNIYNPIYRGTPFYFCDHDGTLRLYDLQQVIDTTAPALTITSFATNSDFQFISSTIEDSVDPTKNQQFNMGNLIYASNNTNGCMLENGFEYVIVSSPNTDLYSVQATNIDKINSKYLIKSDISNKLKFNKLLKNISRNYYKTSNYDYSTADSINDICDDYLSSQLLKIKFTYQSLLKPFLTCVGKKVTVKNMSTDYTPYAGNYICNGVNLTIYRNKGTYSFDCDVVLARSMVNI